MRFVTSCVTYTDTSQQASLSDIKQYDANQRRLLSCTNMAPFGLISKEGNSHVPLKSIQIRSRVYGYTAEVAATMEYQNKGDTPIEAVYVFPLDEEAAVCGFQATIDGRVIVAEVQEKQQARDTYDDAISSGQSAFLLEESDESSDIFQINVGNLPPKQSATVEITFVASLTVEKEGRVVFVLPSVLNPRYTPSNSQQSVSATLPSIASVSTKYSFDFELDVQCATPIQEITSPCNRLKVDINSEDNRQATVRLDQEYEFDVDVQVHVLCSKPFEPHALVENGVTKAKDGKTNDFIAKPVVMLNFFPVFDSSASLDRGEFIFVVDRSGSMRGSKIKSARESLLLFLKSLPDGCYFNVIGFGSAFVKLFTKSDVYNDRTLDQACSHAKSMEADLGGTEILRPLQDVFSQPLIKGYPRQVFLLTDGEVGNTQEVIGLVRQNAHKARSFTFGIGEGASTALVKGVARAGKGSAEFAYSEDRLQAKVMKTLKSALLPAVKDVHVTWTLPKSWDVQIVPTADSTIFWGSGLVLYGILTRKDQDKLTSKQILAIEGTATLSGQIDRGSNSSTIHYVTKFSAVCGNPGDRDLLLHRLCAKAAIRELQDQHQGNAENIDHNLKDHIVEMSKSANVVSKYTSFVAVDQHSHQPVSRPMDRPMRQDEMCGGGRVFALCSQPAAFSGIPAPPGCAPHFAMPARMQSTRVPPAPPGGIGSVSPPPPPPREQSSKIAAQRRRVEYNSTTSHDQPRSKTPPQVDRHLLLIGLQKASGYWQLTQELANLCDNTLDELKKACPTELTADDKDNIWATALVLSCLPGKFGDRRDEWEMVAAKGTKWLKTNLLASTISYDRVMEFASRFLGFVL